MTSKESLHATKSSAAVAEDKPPVAACVKPRVKDRIFDTACDLFYKHGIRDVGVDMIATEAGTNKMSFYRSFPSKDELVAQYLREQQREVWEHWDAAIGPR